ncbi:[NiFe]-hydrogenase assembly chaperone HybE [Vreelandella olivaria]|uniref:[NiFe]-hydrogenase assembly chaperone HybE n=1 Tax=Vreelandella olivaria TaxID=390919 RepID=UPI00201FAB2C|nr:[NiFe]-hydrogenase assembly chaperone HybE [Halomonas olivaria]
MPSLAPEEYQHLAAMAQAYRDVYLPGMKNSHYRNPYLGVDALCFEYIDATVEGASLMVGALITPCELWLVAVPDQATLIAPLPETLPLELPSGRYLLALERLPGGYEIYKRAILEDLSELASIQEASRLAQHMMLRLMTPK